MIIASFPTGVSNITVNGLTQWDYGRKLQIQAPDLPATIEVHFWCVGMDEAVVRSCDALNGVAEAAIPDRCLEQTGPVVAWVYEIRETAGATTKTITMPITARVRPQPNATVPEDISDKYTEALAAMNTVVAKLENGDVTVKRASTADRADTAVLAETASLAKRHLYHWKDVYEGQCRFNTTGIYLSLKPGESYLFEVVIGGATAPKYTFMLKVSDDPLYPRSVSSAVLYEWLAIEGGAVTKAGIVQMFYYDSRLSIVARDLTGALLDMSPGVIIRCATLSGDATESLYVPVTLADLASGGTFRFVCEPDNSNNISVGVWTTDTEGNMIQEIISAYFTDRAEIYEATVEVDAFKDGEKVQHEAFTPYQIYRVV